MSDRQFIQQQIDHGVIIGSNANYWQNILNKPRIIDDLQVGDRQFTQQQIDKGIIKKQK